MLHVRHFELLSFCQMTPTKWKLLNGCVLVLFIIQCAFNVMFYVSRPYLLRTTNDSSVGDNRVLSPKLKSRGIFHVDNGQLRFLLNSERDSRLSGRAKPLCPEFPPRLKGHLHLHPSSRNVEEIELNHPELEAGGSWHPVNCSSRHRVAIIIPYRDRLDHLQILLDHLHPYLQKQLLDYTIFVIEQDTSAQFNRGMLLNIGFKEANSVNDPYDCFVFHDVDLLPEDDRNIYACADRPRHLSAAVDSMGYKLPYDAIFGGVSAISRQQFQLVNGYSNKFFGWGAEDDDLFNRLKYNGLNITRYPMHIARYKMLLHRKSAPGRHRFEYLENGLMRYDRDGLNSLTYERTTLDRRKLFTLVSVVIDEQAVITKLHSASLANRTSPYLASRANAMVKKERMKTINLLKKNNAVIKTNNVHRSLVHNAQAKLAYHKAPGPL